MRVILNLWLEVKIYIYILMIYCLEQVTLSTDNKAFFFFFFFKFATRDTYGLTLMSSFACLSRQITGNTKLIVSGWK